MSKEQEQLLKDIHNDLTESMSIIYSKINNLDKKVNLLVDSKKQNLVNESEIWNNVLDKMNQLDKLGNGS